MDLLKRFGFVMILILFKFFACPSPLYLDLCDRRQVDIIVITSIMCIHRHIVCYGEFSIMGHKIWSSFDRSLVWWRRRELYLDCKLLINIALMGLGNCFCHILCYLKYSILIPRVEMYTPFMAHQKNSCK